MKTLFLLCSEGAARTESGQFILHKIIERIVTKDVPSEEAPLTLPALSVSFEIRDAELSQARQVQVQMTHRESAKSLFDQGFTVEPTTDPAQKISGLLNFHLFPIKALGHYEVRVLVDGQEAAANDFVVVQQA
ncbi:hypothetical protein KBD13_00225 [Patescibacteria group bacterium]|jgi:hypothetical protein|nr:hypothetical protein [Patescibacteria group bacterium]MDQ5919757.1 hypothetical protein [Patescibacteria group bacterium]